MVVLIKEIVRLFEWREDKRKEGKRIFSGRKWVRHENGMKSRRTEEVTKHTSAQCKRFYSFALFQAYVAPNITPKRWSFLFSSFAWLTTNSAYILSSIGVSFRTYFSIALNIIYSSIAEVQFTMCMRTKKKYFSSYVFGGICARGTTHAKSMCVHARSPNKSQRKSVERRKRNQS